MSRKTFRSEVDVHLHDVFACSEKFLTLPKTPEVLLQNSQITGWIAYDAMLFLSEFMAAVGQDVSVANAVELSWLSLWNFSER
jgi:hypothetical protein